MEKKPVTRKDIAELCGVSVSVVSRALNNSIKQQWICGGEQAKKNHRNSRKAELYSAACGDEPSGAQNETAFVLL